VFHYANGTTRTFYTTGEVSSDVTKESKEEYQVINTIDDGGNKTRLQLFNTGTLRMIFGEGYTIEWHE